MKVTRYYQSCLLLEENDARILIDPSAQEKQRLGEFGRLDAVLYTHEHSDHFDAQMAQDFVEQGMAPVYANASTSKLIKASKTEVKDGDEFEIAGVKIKAYELPHCLMWDGRPGPQNTGYLINNKLFHPGDGKELAGLEAEILAVPINGPDISLKDAFDFAKQLKPSKLIPIHYDYLGGKPEAFARVGQGMGFDTVVLQLGETAQL